MCPGQFNNSQVSFGPQTPDSQVVDLAGKNYNQYKSQIFLTHFH